MHGGYRHGVVLVVGGIVVVVGAVVVPVLFESDALITCQVPPKVRIPSPVATCRLLSPE